MLKLKAMFMGVLVLFFYEKMYGQLTADFTSDVVSGCAPIRVVFTDKSTGGATDWKWDLGNGTIAEQTTEPSTTYLTAGTFSVKLTVYKGTDSAKVFKTNYITVFATPKVNFGALPTSGCLPVVVRFKDSSVVGGSGTATFQWDFGDGNIGTGQNPSHTYYNPGNFKVTLTVKNGSGCISNASRLNYITAYDSIRAGFGIKAPAGCAVPATYFFTDSSTGNGITKWNWDFGDGNTSTSKNPTHVYSTKGTYAVTLIIQNTNGCLDTLQKKDAITSGNFTADFDGTASVCAGIPLTFTNKSIPANLITATTWNFGDNELANTVDATHAYASAGNYKVKLITWFGACADSVEKSVSILKTPVADFSAVNTAACKPPLSVQFINKTTGGAVVKWDFGNGKTSTENNPSITYEDYGRFNVSLTVRNGNGCLNTIIKNDFVVIEKPAITGISGLSYENCIPWTNTFSVGLNNNAAIAKYEWDFGDGTTSTLEKPMHTFTDTTKYDVKVMITTADGCTDAAASFVHGGFRPKPNFTAAPLSICRLDPVSFSDLSSPTTNSWYWLFGDGGTSTEQNPIHLYADTGYMNVTLVAYNNGCGDSLTFSKYVYVNPPIARFIDTFNCVNPYKIFFTDKSLGGKSWQWIINDIDSFETKDLEYVFADTGVYKVRLVIKDSLCKDRIETVIKIIDEKAAFVTTDSGFCGVSYKQFIVTGPRTNPENIAVYSWDFGDGFTLVTDTPVVVHPYTSIGTVNVKLIITDINGCNDTAVIPVKIKLYGPKAEFTPAFTAICAGSLVTFTDSTAFDAVRPVAKWKWDFGEGSIKEFTSAPFTNIYSNAGVYSVKLIVEDIDGCMDSILKPNAVVVYKPVANFASADTIVCLNSPVSFVNNSTGVAIRSNWNFGNGKSSNALAPITRYDSAGAYDISLIVTDSLKCRDTLVYTKYISVGNVVAAFSVSDSFTTCPPLLVGFTNKSSYHISAQWDFGNGNFSSLENPSHTYTSPGKFIAKLMVTGNGGCKDSAVKKIELQGPFGDFVYGPVSGCQPLVVSFVTHPKNTTRITYDFSDGLSTITNDTTAVHTYRIPGTFVPKAIFSDDLGCKLPMQGLDTIRVLGAKAFIKSLPVSRFCDSGSVRFFDSTITVDIIKSFNWDFGDGGKSTDQNPIHLYNKEGRYQVTLEVQTSVGCISKDTLQQEVIIARKPHIDIGIDAAACVPATIQFNAKWLNKDTAALISLWDFGNNNSSDQFIPAPVLYDKPGKFKVSFIVTNSYGCGDTAIKVFTINDSPKVVAGPASFICLGNSLNLFVRGGLTYQWESNISLSCLNCANPVAKPISEQQYRVTATDTNGCKASDTFLVKVKPPPVFTHGIGDTICVGQQVQLQAMGTEKYSWSPAEGLSSTTIPNPVAKPVITTNYRVIGYDSLGCFMDTAYLNVVVYPIPVFNILEEKISGISGNTVSIQTASSADITQWHWSPSTNLSCTDCAVPQVKVGIPVTYLAQASNPGHCLASDKVTVVPVCDKNNVFIPNTFSPNGDGQNDVFFPHAKGLTIVKSMQVFSRWGELLFSRKDFSFNDPAAGWDGTYKGAKLTPDVYVYTIDVLCDNNETFSLKGDVTLIR